MTATAVAQSFAVDRASALTAAGRSKGGLALSREATVVKTRVIPPTLVGAWVID